MFFVLLFALLATKNVWCLKGVDGSEVSTFAVSTALFSRYNESNTFSNQQKGDTPIRSIQEQFPFLFLHSEETLRSCNAPLLSCVTKLFSVATFYQDWLEASAKCSMHYCTCLPSGSINPSTDQCKYRASPRTFCSVVETCFPVYNRCVRLFEIASLPPACDAFIQCTAQPASVQADQASCVAARQSSFGECNVAKTCLVDVNYNVTKWLPDGESSSGDTSSGSGGDDSDTEVGTSPTLSFGIISLVSILGVAILWGCCATVCILCIRMRAYLALQRRRTNRDPNTTAAHRRLERVMFLYEAFQRSLSLHFPNGTGAGLDGNGTAMKDVVQIHFLSREEPITECDVCHGASGTRLGYLTIPCLCAVCETCALKYDSRRDLIHPLFDTARVVNGNSTSGQGASAHTTPSMAAWAVHISQGEETATTTDSFTTRNSMSPIFPCTSSSVDRIPPVERGNHSGLLPIVGASDATHQFQCCIACETPLCYPLIALDHVYANGFQEDTAVVALSPTAAATSDESLCVICLEHKVDILFIPCGHYATCRACSTRLAETNETATCPLCRDPFVMLCQVHYARSLHTPVERMIAPLGEDKTMHVNDKKVTS